MSVTPECFREQVSLLIAKGYRVCSLEEFFFSPEPDSGTGRPSVAITFDDGYRDWYDNAFPILREARLPAHFFLATNLLKKGEGIPRYRGLAPELRAPLETEMLREMTGEGMFFESHGVSHRQLADLPLSERRREYVRSAEIIAEACGRRPRWFAYPRGKLPPEEQERQELLQAGYRGAMTVRPGPNFIRAGTWAMRRTEISGDDTLRDFQTKLDGGFDCWHRIWQAVGGEDRTAFAARARREEGSE